MRENLWSEEEDAILERVYPQHGAKAVHRRTGRTVRAIYRRAQILGVAYGVTEGRRSIKEICHETGLHRATVLKAARNDGVCKMYGKGGKPIAVVPTKWAEEYIRSRNEWRQEGLADAYITIEEVARAFNMNRSTIRRWLTGYPTGGKYLANVRSRFVSNEYGLTRVFNPLDVYRAYEAWRDAGHQNGKPGPKVSERKYDIRR